ncbi:predicted protein [Histoplasma capsulatum var. duboisii H88]|uniref:Predicted protein n=1 Tax=Ajellomyces capsulatus (strain H88) TaxID=544711 RepID=F0UV95_AJEC8|nr:predicted protein [Histoplasma capsulatum var. duboisii H88]
MTKQGNNRTGCPYMSRKHKASKHKARRKGKEFEKSNVGQGFETRIVVVGAALDIDIRTPARVEQQARPAQYSKVKPTPCSLSPNPLRAAFDTPDIIAGDANALSRKTVQSHAPNRRTSFRFPGPAPNIPPRVKVALRDASRLCMKDTANDLATILGSVH